MTAGRPCCRSSAGHCSGSSTSSPDAAPSRAGLDRGLADPRAVQHPRQPDTATRGRRGPARALQRALRRLAGPPAGPPDPAPARAVGAARDARPAPVDQRRAVAARPRSCCTTSSCCPSTRVLDRTARVATARPRVPAVNYLRVPAALSALLLVVLLGGHLRRRRGTLYTRVSGLSTRATWALAARAAALFAVSTALYLLRLLSGRRVERLKTSRRRARRRTSARCAGRPRP